MTAQVMRVRSLPTMTTGRRGREAEDWSNAVRPSRLAVWFSIVVVLWVVVFCRSGSSTVANGSKWWFVAGGSWLVMGNRLTYSRGLAACWGCGFVCHRDLNAAINLRNLASSSGVSACGEFSANTRRSTPKRKQPLRSRKKTPSLPMSRFG